MKCKHITRTMGVCGGRKIIRGTRIEVEKVVEILLQSDLTIEESYITLQQDYGLLREQIKEVEDYHRCFKNL